MLRYWLAVQSMPDLCAADNHMPQCERCVVYCALSLVGQPARRVACAAVKLLVCVCVQPSLLQILMPPLQEKWASIPDTDRELQPLFECFTSLATALGVLTLHCSFVLGLQDRKAHV